MTTERFHYRAFGLDIDLELEIAHLPLCAASPGKSDRWLTLKLGKSNRRRSRRPACAAAWCESCFATKREWRASDDRLSAGRRPT